MAARKPDHPLQRYGSARVIGFAISRQLHHLPGHDHLPSATPGAGTRSALPVAHTAPLGVFKTAEALIAAG